MKAQLLNKAKWYVLGILSVVMILSVAISYCAWDNLSINAAVNGSSGDFLNYTVKLQDDNDKNGVISIGDVVVYGRFYQDSNAIDTHETKPLRWIVVDLNSTNNVATLLAEKVLVYGNFWGNAYVQQSSNIMYYDSTVRSWLNSGKGSLLGNANGWNDSQRENDNSRSDGFGSTFSIDQSNQVNKGFLDVAFSEYEKSFLVPKKIYDIKIVYSDKTISKSLTNKNYVNDLVWIPSISELFNSTETPWGTSNDGMPNTQFTLFKGAAHDTINNNLVCGASAYAWNASNTSYTNSGKGTTTGSVNATSWVTRSPDSAPEDSDKNVSIIITNSGKVHFNRMFSTNIGVRPAVNVKLK